MDIRSKEVVHFFYLTDDIVWSRKVYTISCIHQPMSLALFVALTINTLTNA